MTGILPEAHKASGYNVKLYISRGRLAFWLLAFLHSESKTWKF